jgi:DNA polymerase V
MAQTNPILTSQLQFFALDTSGPSRPLAFYPSVSAGFPSPAADYVQNKIDLNEKLIEHPAATFLVRVQGDSMIDANLHDGDLLLVDRSITPRHRHIVVAILNGEFTVKRLIKSGGDVFLKAENKAYRPIEIREGMDFEVWGVVRHIIHQAS